MIWNDSIRNATCYPCHGSVHVCMCACTWAGMQAYLLLNAHMLEHKNETATYKTVALGVRRERCEQALAVPPLYS